MGFEQGESLEGLVERLRKKLWFLRDRHGVDGVKGGTEVEDMDLEELKILRKISMGLVPMILKIGGVEARNDMRMGKLLKVEGILGPMVESSYGLLNFTGAMGEVFGEEGVWLAINIETVTAYYQLSEIFGLREFQKVSQVTVGRSDLAGSMGYGVGSQEVEEMAQDIIKRAKVLGKTTSVGGKIDRSNIERIKAEVKPDKINTRHISIDLKKCQDLDLGVLEALLFEIELYKILIGIGKEKYYHYIRRIEETKKRIEKSSSTIRKANS